MMGTERAPLRRDPFYPGNGIEKASGTYKLQTCSDWSFRRSDSTLALLVTHPCLLTCWIPRENIHCITMPCFRYYRPYLYKCRTMAKKTGASLTEINIRDAVTGHFKDIAHDMEKHDVTYENGQARERTQILMDIANEVGGMVIGTGDMSELALGWATYNGDHMSMYGVNASVPKTLVRHLVRYYADTP